MPFLLILNLYTRHLSISHYLMLISNGHTGEVAHEEFLLGQSIQGARVYLYPHLHFSIGYNGPQVSTIDPISSPSSASIIKGDTNIALLFLVPPFSFMFRLSARMSLPTPREESTSQKQILDRRSCFLIQ